MRIVLNWCYAIPLFFSNEFLQIITVHYLSHVMRKTVYAICEQQRRRSACASAQSDQRLCCSLPGWYNISSFYIRNFNLASFCGCAGRFESYQVAYPEDRFSRDEAHFIKFMKIIFLIYSYVIKRFRLHRKNPKISDTWKFAVITLKVEQDVFSLG